MANTAQARKRARQAVARNQHLSAQRSQYRTAIKKVRKLVAAGDKAAAQAAATTAYRKLDKAVAKGVIHKNQAANRKSAVASAAAAL